MEQEVEEVEASPKGGATSKGRGRGCLFALVFALGFLLLAEGLGWIALAVSDGGWMSVAERREARRLAGGDAAEDEEAEPVSLEQAAVERGAEGGAGRGEVLHPFLGFVRNPDVPGAHWARVGPKGFYVGRPKAERHREPTEAPPFRVAIFGGSVANILSFAGAGVLRDTLAASPVVGERPVEIQSFAMGGYKQPQQLIALNYALAQGDEFDLVINVDGFNDMVLSVVDNFRRRIEPTYPRGWSRRVSDVPDLEAQRTIGEIAYLETRRARTATLCDGAVISASALCHLVWRALDAGQARRLTTLRQELLEQGETRRTFLTHGPAQPKMRRRRMKREIAAFWARSSLAMHQLCASRGIAYLHVLQPNQYVPGSKPLSAHELRHAYDETHPYQAAAATGYPFLQDAASRLVEAGVAYHDLTQLFATEERTLYSDTCCHFNRLGNQLLGAEVGRLARGVLEEPAEPEARLR